MSEIKLRVRELTERIRDLYAAVKKEKFQKSKHGMEIYKLWILLADHMGEPTIDVILYVIETANNKESLNCQKLVRKGIEICASKEHVARLIPHVRSSWVVERAQLLRRLTEVTKDKQELVDWMGELGFI